MTVLAASLGTAPPATPQEQSGPEGPASGRVGVYVHAADPVSAAGMATALRSCPDVGLVAGSVEMADVGVVVCDEPDPEALRAVHMMRSRGCTRTVMVVTRLDDVGVLAAVKAGACALVRRCEATPERLAQVLRDVTRGHGAVPADLLGRLLGQVGRIQREVLTPRGLAFGELNEREIAIVSLLAEGWNTAAVARELCYSERTVKQVVHDLVRRLGLRNRTHLVAYAARELII